MSLPIPNTRPALWNIEIYKGSTWPGTTISMTRDGVQIIPVSASLTFRSPTGTLLVTLAATIDGGGVMTVPSISAVATGGYSWEYANALFRVTEGSGRITDLLAGNVTAVSRVD